MTSLFRGSRCCQVCLIPLDGALDTYGLPGEERCFNCFLNNTPLVELYDEELIRRDRMEAAEEMLATAKRYYSKEEVESARIHHEQVRRDWRETASLLDSRRWWESWWRDHSRALPPEQVRTEL